MTSFEVVEDLKKAEEFLEQFLPSSKPSWTASIGNKVGHVLKTKENDQIASAIIYQQLEQNEHWVFIHAIATRQDERNRGYARALLEKLMKKDRAPHMICLEASDLLQIYRNFGFIPSSSHDKEIKREIKTLGKGPNKTLVLDNKAFTERKKLFFKFCAQLGCEPSVAEKVARRLAFLHGSGNTEPELSNNNYLPHDSQELPEIFRGADDFLSFVKGDGIPPILLTLAGGIGVNTDYKVVHNPQPAINRDLNNSRLIKLNQEKGIIDSFLGPTTVDQVGFAFLPFVMEQPPEGSTAHVDLPCPPNGISNVRLAGIAKARPITHRDVDNLASVLKVELTYMGEMTMEQRLHLVFQGITKNFNGFKSRVDLQKLLQLLLLSVETVHNGSIDAAALHCWDDIREVIYLTKLAWVALKLPCLGAIAGKARMYAATHALLGIKATLDLGPPYEPANLELPESIPLSLTLKSTSVEFYAIQEDKTLEDSLDALCNESMAKQEIVTSSTPYGAQELLTMMVRHAAIRPIKPEDSGWIRTSYTEAIKCQVDDLAKQLKTFKIRLTAELNVKAIQKIAVDKIYLLGPRSTLCFSKSEQRIRSTRHAILFYPLIGLLKIETKSDEIPSPHLALSNLIFNNGQQMNGTSLPPGIPLVPTVVSFQNKEDNGNFSLQLEWMKTYMCDLMYPLVTFITQWLCDLKGKSSSSLPSTLGKDLVCQWVWAFVWELLDHYRGPYIDIPWLLPAGFHMLRELLYWKDDVRNMNCLKVLNKTRPEEYKEKVFKSNLYGLVVYLIYHMELGGDFTLDHSFQPAAETFGIGTAQHESTLDEAIYNATCPRFKRESDGKILSLFQMTQCLLVETKFAKDMARKVDVRLRLWGALPSKVLDDLFAADPNCKQKSSGARSVDVTAAKLRLVLSWWVPPGKDEPDIENYTTLQQLENLLAKHIKTALAPLQAKQRKGLRNGEDILTDLAKELQFVDIKESADDTEDDEKDDESMSLSGKPSGKRKPKGKGTSSQKKRAKSKGKSKGTNEESDASSKRTETADDTEDDEKDDESMSLSGKPSGKRKPKGKGTSSQKKRAKSKGKSKGTNEESDASSKRTETSVGKPPTPPEPPSDEEMAEDKTNLPSSDLGKRSDEEMAEAPKDKSKSPSGEPGEANQEVVRTLRNMAASRNEAESNIEERLHTLGATAVAAATTSKQNATQQTPADPGTKQYDDKWERLKVKKWTPASKVIPDPKLTKEVLLMPCLDNSAHAEIGPGTVQFRKLTIGKIQCYICDFVPQDHLMEMLLFHHSEAFRECYSNNAMRIDPYNVCANTEEEEACKRFANMNDKEREEYCKGMYYTYYSKYKADKSYWYEEGSNDLKEKMQVVDNFMDAIAKGVKEARKGELNIDIDFKEMHAVALTTMHDASHQRAHLDHNLAYGEEKDAPEQRAYIGHMPLQSEGMVLRLENLTEEMLNSLNRGNVFDHGSEAVEDHLYLHIPFGSILLIDERTFHGGHYGTAAKHRFHFVLSPYDWSPWKNRKRENTTADPKPMTNAEKEFDNLLFLTQCARVYSNYEWSRGDDDPNVAIPQLDTQEHLDLSKISKKKEYLKKRGPFCEQIAKKLLDHGNMKEESIRYIIDNY